MTARCPHCQVGRISLVQKLLFGPIFRFRCTHCGNRWRVSHWSVVVALLAIAGTPVEAGLALAFGLTKSAAVALLGSASFNLALTVLAMTFWVPVRRVGDSASSLQPDGKAAGLPSARRTHAPTTRPTHSSRKTSS